MSEHVERSTAVTKDTDSRTAVVTGANRGIGLAIAQRLLDEGYQVAGICRTGDGPEGVFNVSGDMRDSASVDAAFTAIEEHQSPTEVLVADAGITADTLV